MNTKKIGFIGAGNMASSLMKGLIASGHAPELLWASDPNQEALQQLADQLTIHTCDNNIDLIHQVDVVVLAVKPQVMHTVLEPLVDAFSRNNVLIVSIAAGISQSSLSQWIGEKAAIVRCMPNTPSLVQTGATALHANDAVSEEQKTLAENILRAVGICLWVEYESKLDAVTAISGSGPAYFFLLMEAMEKTAAELGLSQETAKILVQQTALGSAKIALESEESSAELRKRVTSPGGTTEQAINTFVDGDFSQLVSKALHAARDRSITMSTELGDK